MRERSGRPPPRNAPKGSFASSGDYRTHAHQILPDPAGKFVLHVDLGLDQIFAVVTTPRR
jgi:6-phosphogluconolactonase (cycloisomerase 2 family)